MKKVFITLCASAFLGVSSLFALPARSIPETVTQPDGTVVTVRVVGDEFYHYQMTADGIPVVRGADGFYRYAELTPDGTAVAGQVIARDAHLRTASDKVYLEQLAARKVSQGMVAQRQLKRQQKLRSVTRRTAQATTGDDVHGLVLLVEFSDKKFDPTNTLEDFKEMMNKEGYDYQGAIGSARDYFIAQSDGQFRPTFDVVGPITLDRAMAYYGGNDKYTGNDSRPEDMVIDACRKIESTVDFTIYDRDNDGFVDLVYVIYAGYGESANDNAGSLDDTIWPHAYYVYQGAGKEVSVDGKLLDAYACSAELQGNTGTYRDGIGSFCHEYSHTLGLPDFYDTSGSYRPNYGMSSWSLMDYGCYNGPDMNDDGHSDGSVPVGYTAYEREFCGWLTIEELTEPATLTLENLADSKKAYKIVSSDQNQYFTLENRQQTGWDTYMASSGLMILKVDYDQMIWDNNIVNCEPTRQRMTIMPADNHRSFYDETGDLYPYNNNNSFTDQSAPASKTNTGLSLGKPVTNITQANGVITFDFMGGSAIEAPVANEATGITATGFTANWSPVEGAASYTLHVDRRQPSAGGEILLSEDFAKCTVAGTANLGGTNAFQTVDGQYFQTSGWSGKYLYPEVGMMKMGNSSNGGALCTPAIDLSSNGGTFTVQFAASRYDNDKEKTVMKVYLEGDEAHAQTTEMLPLDAMNTYTLTFTGGTESSKIVFESTADSGKKRAYIDNIVVYSGEVQPEAMAKPAAVEWPMVIEGITETAYSLTGLEPGYLYSYKVKAVTDDSKESAYSNVVKVDLSSGICDVLEVNHRIYAAEGGIVIECETAQPVEIVNLAGQVVASTEVNGRAVVPVPAAGVYIVRCGAAATRVMVR